MSRVLIYQGSFVNTETTRPGNVNIQQVCVLKIYDTEAETDNPYNIQALVHDNGDGTQSVQFTIDSYPDETLNLSIQYSTDNGGSWIELGVYGPTYIASHTIPTGEYLYQLIFFTISEPAPDGIPYILNPPAVDVIPLEMTDENGGQPPVVLSEIDNDEDPLSPVRSKQLEIGIYSGNGVDISSFADGGDQRWYVEYLVNNQIKFIGFLSISDLDQTFMPDPNVINLVATDGLGFLSDIPIKDFDGVNPTNENKIMDFIAWSLRKTGLELPIVVCMNIRERFATPLVSDDTGDGHFYKWCYLDAKTFEKEIGESEDCRTVLEKIFGEMCSLYQDNGEWFIMRKDEMDFNRPYYLFKFDFQGNFIEKSEENFEKNIGVDLPLSWMEDALVLLERAYRLLELTYNYVYPKEIPCNREFERGDFIDDLADETIDGQVYNVKKYETECWTIGRYSSTTPETVGATSSTTYIKKYFQNGYEKMRFVVVENAESETNPYTYLRSEPIYLTKSDKGEASLDFKYSTPPAGNDHTVAGFVFLGDSGTTYILNSINGYWIASVANSFFGTETFTYPSAESKAEFNGQSYNIAPAPEDGKLYIFLSASYASGSDLYYNNLQLTIYPFINGSYTVYTGQRHSAEQAINTVALRQTEVFMSDSPRRAIRGSLLKENAGDYSLANEFYDASLFPNADFTDDDIRPFGEIQLFDVWNQINRLMRRFDGVIDGLESNGDMPDLKYKYFITDANQNTDNKMFMLLHFEQEQHLCEQTSYLTEVADSTIDKVYTGNTFKYITSGE